MNGPGCGFIAASTPAEALARAASHSPYLRGLIRREEELVGRLEAGDFDGVAAEGRARLDPADALASLRRAKAAVALGVAIADLSGAWPLETVTATLSAAADAAIGFALATALEERGMPRDAQGLVVLGLGKLGSHELNYSSDVDLIVLHDPARLPVPGGADVDETAVRLTRRLSALLAERTPDGYAWRVDLRLRPDPDSTPPSLRLGAAELYYQSQALAWERSAFIRARPVAGDLAMGRDFLALLAPFVWRRSLDYSALAEIGEVSHRIRDHFGEVEAFGPGFDLKRGRGGIREVEFHAQVLQLIFGGREPALRVPATLDALAALAAAGRLPAGDSALLAAAYRDQRTLEHRLQMLADQQTHRIPTQAGERAQLAGLCGLGSFAEVARRIEPQVKAVARLYDRLLAAGSGQRLKDRVPRDGDAVVRWARAAGLADPELVGRLVTEWRSGRPRSLRAPESIAAFETVLPQLLRAPGRGPAGRQGLVRLGDFIDALPSGVQFWRLLVAQPALAGLLGRLLTETPLLADRLAARPELIDVVIDPPPPLAGVEAALAELGPQPPQGLEAALDRVRQWTADRRFRIGLDLLEGQRSPAEAAAELSDLAEAAVVWLQEAVTRDFVRRHGQVPGAELVVLALGRFGGRALTHQSDLDIVLLFTGHFEARSDGPEPLGASAWFNRLGQRLVGALSAPTAQGPLYAVDTRLRPSGAQGLLVVSLDSFAAYQAREAELWETLALTRARVISGSAGARAAVDGRLQALLAVPRDAPTVHSEALAMRRLMDRHKPAAGPFDVKLMKGGLVDLEFVVGCRGLVQGRRLPPDLERAAAEVAPGLVGAHATLMAILVLLRLILPADRAATPDRAATALLARACGKSGAAALRADLGLARAAVLAAWEEEFGTRR